MKLSKKLTAKIIQLRSQKGAALVEYALVVGLVSLASVGALQSLGGGIGTVFDNITAALAAINITNPT